MDPDVAERIPLLSYRSYSNNSNELSYDKNNDNNIKGRRQEQQQQQYQHQLQKRRLNNSSNTTTTVPTTYQSSNILGFFRRIGRGLHHCTISTRNNCIDCCGYRTTWSTKKRNGIISTTSNTSIDDDGTSYYYEDEFIDDDDIGEERTSRYSHLFHNNINNNNNNTNRKSTMIDANDTLLSYCTYGTDETSNVWFNYNDQVGTIMSCSVWVLIGYSAWTIMILAQNHHVSVIPAAIYWTICTLALSCHIKTTLTNPGSIPKNAIPTSTSSASYDSSSYNNKRLHHNNHHTMCSTCHAYKPQTAHHCRICNRCVAKMDHHCPWMNNCVGANNLKYFILFLLYVWIGCTMALILFAINYFACTDISCEFGIIEIQLVRIMTILCILTLIFVSSMILNVMYGIITGVGTIDRLQKKALKTWSIADEEPIPLCDIFGIDNKMYWLLPTTPTFPDYERIMGYTTTKRHKRRLQQQHDRVVMKMNSSSSYLHHQLQNTFSDEHNVSSVITTTTSSNGDIINGSSINNNDNRRKKSLEALVVNQYSTRAASALSSISNIKSHIDI